MPFDRIVQNQENLGNLQASKTLKAGRILKVSRVLKIAKLLRLFRMKSRGTYGGLHYDRATWKTSASSGHYSCHGSLNAEVEFHESCDRSVLRGELAA